MQRKKPTKNRNTLFLALAISLASLASICYPAVVGRVEESKSMAAACWGSKSHKSSKEQKAAAPEEEHHHNDYIKASSVNNDEKKSKRKRMSLGEIVSGILISRNLAGTSKNFGESCGSDSNGHSGGGLVSKKKGHPSPQPSVSSAQSLVIDHGVGSGSSDDAIPDLAIFCNSSGEPRAHGENNLRSRSSSPRSRGPPTLPLHPRLSLEPPTRKQEHGISLCHPLQLPLGESTHCLGSKWKKGKLLGRGTYSHVYVGFQSEIGKMCTIKEVMIDEIDKFDQSSNECLKQLNQEITLLSQLSHQNIVRCHGSELEEGRLSVYLEYVSVGTIHELLEEYGPFKEPLIQSYTSQILSGLAYLHGRNIVHRDIRAANILVGPRGEVKLAGFGMAKHATSFSSELFLKRSVHWMAPEVVMDCSGGYSLAVDIWSLGWTILEMATSNCKPPWSQYEGVGAIFKIVNSKDIPEIPDHLSCNAKSFLRLCLQRDPSARPTAAQLMDHPFIRDQAAAASRANLSSPVVMSPCSSPLRQHEVAAHKCCFVSTPYPPAYTFGGQGLNYNLMLPNTNYADDPCFDILHPRIQEMGFFSHDDRR